MNRNWILSASIIAIHLVFLIFTRFTLWPEMVVYPYLLNHGFALYRDIINPYPPVFIYLLSIFSKVFGYNPPPYKILTWIVIAAIDLSIFLLSKNVTKNSKTVFLSVLFFSLASIPF